MRTVDITNVTQHREHLREHLNQVKETGRPLFITNKSGETEAVVMGAQAYDALIEEVELARRLTMLDQGMEAVRKGRGKDFKKAIRDIASELGLTLDR